VVALAAAAVLVAPLAIAATGDTIREGVRNPKGGRPPRARRRSSPHRQGRCVRHRGAAASLHHRVVPGRAQPALTVFTNFTSDEAASAMIGGRAPPLGNRDDPACARLSLAAVLLVLEPRPCRSMTACGRHRGVDREVDGRGGETAC